MKSVHKFFRVSIPLLIVAYVVLATLKVQDLEKRMQRQQVAAVPEQQLAFSFDASFLSYFGPEEVAEIERAMRQVGSDEALRRLDFPSYTTVRFDLAPREAAEWNPDGMIRK